MELLVDRDHHAAPLSTVPVRRSDARLPRVRGAHERVPADDPSLVTIALHLLAARRAAYEEQRDQGGADVSTTG